MGRLSGHSWEWKALQCVYFTKLLLMGVLMCVYVCVCAFVFLCACVCVCVGSLPEKTLLELPIVRTKKTG